LGFNDKALEHCFKSIQIFEAIYPDKKHLFVGYAYNILAMCYFQNGDISLALDHLMISIEIMKSCFPNENQYYFGIIYFNTGEIYLKMNNLVLALDYYLKSKNVRETIFKNNQKHPLLHKTYVALSNIYKLMNENEHSEEYMKKAQKVLDQ